MDIPACSAWLTFSIVPAANPMTNALPFQAMHLRESIFYRIMSGSHHDNQVQKRAIDKTDRVVNNIDSFSFCQCQHLFLPPWIRVIDTIICASVAFGDFDLLGRAGSGYHISAQCYVQRRNAKDQSHEQFGHDLQIAKTDLWQFGLQQCLHRQQLQSQGPTRLYS